MRVGFTARLIATTILLLTAPAFAEQQDNTSFRAIAEAEARGDLKSREEMINVALQRDDTLAELHWQQGEMREGGRWTTVEEHIAAVKPKKVLAEYRALRAKSDATLKSQQELATFCRKHDLVQQERAHLTAILELDPENERARKRLGYEKVEGSWQLPEEVAQARKAATAAAQALRKHRPEIIAIRDGLAEGELTIAAAAEQLAAMDEPGVIAAWESMLSTTAAGAEAVVTALMKLPYPAAAQSLARHALYSPAVREKAAKALTDRDEHSYIPELLAELRSPALAASQLLSTPDGRLLYRHALYADGQDRQQLAVFDQAFFLAGDRNVAARMAAWQAMATQRVSEAQRAAYNAEVDRHNAEIMKLLREVTQEQEADSPQDWWQWWNDRNEIHYSGDKPLQGSYAYTSTQVVGQPLPPLGSSSGSGRSTPQRTGKDCLAGGTPVVTELGPVAVDRIRLGDLVLAQNEQTGELAFKPVLRTTVRAPERLIRISLKEEVIRASGGHPFWVAGKGWMRARELEPGMVLHGAAEPRKIENIAEEQEPVKTFNLVVADFHSYFAGKARVLSHDNTLRGTVERLVPGVTK
jgi:hypothetical protein